MLKIKLFLLAIIATLSIKTIAQCPVVFNLGNDTILCQNEVLTIDATTVGATSYLWQDNSISPLLNVTQTGTYFCEVARRDSNLIENGDFELGDTLFTTGYVPGTGGAFGLLSSEGQYAISTSPSNTHNNFPVCIDHTSGTGNMMVVNGSSTPNTSIWSQTLNVIPNTDYEFSIWVYVVIPSNPPTIQFSVNNVNIGTPNTPTLTVCNWQQFTQTWNSGTSTTALLDLINQTTAQSGNDFAIDDISFSTLCSSTDSINVTFINSPVVNLGNDTNLCVGATLALDASGPNTTYLWQDNSINSTFTVSQSGLYSVQVTSDTNGCITTDSINVAINPFPVVNLGNDTSLCLGQSLFLLLPIPNATYIWQDSSTNFAFTITQPGTYFVEVTVSGCSTTDTIVVNSNTSINLGNDTTLCQGQFLTLDATLPNATYLWQDNSINPTFNVNQAGNYSVQVTANGCPGNDTINVFYENPMVRFGNDTILCQGESLTLDASNAGSTYLWQDNSSNSTFNVVEPGGTFGVLVTTANGCQTSDTVTVNYDIINLDFNVDTIFCLGQIITLNATNAGAAYNWQDGSSSSFFDVTVSGTYWVDVVLNNCFETDTISLMSIDCDVPAANVILEVPNVFTPNNDGSNDLFTIINSNDIASMTTIIYNRWGKQIFETNNPLIEWDGEDSSDGTYFWTIDYIDTLGKKGNKNGSLSLLR